MEISSLVSDRQVRYKTVSCFSHFLDEFQFSIHIFAQLSNRLSAHDIEDDLFRALPVVMHRTWIFVGASRKAEHALTQELISVDSFDNITKRDLTAMRPRLNPPETPLSETRTP